MNTGSCTCCISNSLEINKISKIVTILKVVNDTSRLQILCMLRQNEHCVCELIEHLSLSQSLTSHHLKDLKDANLVDNEKRGLRVYYFLTKFGKEITDSVFNLV